jgi:hypothetical protein
LGTVRTSATVTAVKHPYFRVGGRALADIAVSDAVNLAELRVAEIIVGGRPVGTARFGGQRGPRSVVLGAA